MDSKSSGLFIVTILTGLMLLFHFIALLLMLSNHAKLKLPPTLDMLRSMVIMIQVPGMLLVGAAVIYSLGLLAVYESNRRNLSPGERVLHRIHILYVICILIMVALWTIIFIITPLPSK